MDKEQLQQHLEAAAFRAMRAEGCGGGTGEQQYNANLARTHSLVVIAHLLNEVVNHGSMDVSVVGTVRTESGV